jgi:hypothetical protein
MRLGTENERPRKRCGPPNKSKNSGKNSKPYRTRDSMFEDNVHDCTGSGRCSVRTEPGAGAGAGAVLGTEPEPGVHELNHQLVLRFRFRVRALRVLRVREKPRHLAAV